MLRTNLLIKMQRNAKKNMIMTIMLNESAKK